MGKRLAPLLAAAVLQTVPNAPSPDTDKDRGPAAMPAGRHHSPHVEDEPFLDAISERVQREARPSDDMPPGRGTDWDWNEAADDNYGWWVAANATPLGSPPVLLAS
jgi:hypothetical protein